MRWSQMNSAQRAFLAGAARFNQDTICNGRVVRQGVARNDAARVMIAAKALDRDARALEARNGKAAMLDALSVFSPDEIALLASRFESGRAYGANDLNKRKATAMPMRYFRGSQYGC